MYYAVVHYNLDNQCHYNDHVFVLLNCDHTVATPTLHTLYLNHADTYMYQGNNDAVTCSVDMARKLHAVTVC